MLSRDRGEHEVAHESRLKHLLIVAREYLTHWFIAGTIIALTGFAPDHWVAELVSHSGFLEYLRRSGFPGFDLRIGLVAVGVGVIVWDLLRRSRTQMRGAFVDSQSTRDQKHIQATPLPDKPSIAVLPFNNMSGDPEQDYFADGMVEEVITGLSRIKWLLVISRNSSFIYKNKPVVVKEVADKLGIRYVVEGSVRKSRNRVRITAQLIDAETGAHLWAEQYDRLLEDVFALQDDITMCVIGAIEPSLRKAEIARIKRQRPNNLDAYDLVLRSLPFVFTNMPKEAEKAIPLLGDALKLEPNYAVAHAFLSWCLHARFSRGGLQEKDRIASIHHAHAAIAHGNDDATALAIAAFVIALEEHDTTTALKLFDRALEFSNSNIFALSCSAMTLAFLGKTELAIDRAQQALRLSPLDSFNFRSNNALAISYFHTKRYGDAEAAARTAIDANPSFSFTHAVLAATLMRLGRVEEARATAQTVLECEPSFTIRGLLRIVGLEPAVFQPLADAWSEVGLPE
jgi:adenylate cyclase